MELLFYYFVLFFSFSNGYQQTITVKTNKGPIQGYVSYLGGQNSPTNVFKGIPFAKPPVGDLRFRKLKFLNPWENVIDTTKYKPACMSNSSRTTSPQKIISEDCIYMNIFAGANCLKRKCPILVYIHGGNFVYDSAVMFNDTQIIQKYASKDMVFVLPAFRLGIFGFLDLGSDDVVPRNLGLHDVVFGLNWLKIEIENFGGDSKQITLMGNR